SQHQNFDYIIACDHGYEHAKKAGIKPHLIIGDFDSITAETDTQLKKIAAKSKPVTENDCSYKIANDHPNEVEHSNDPVSRKTEKSQKEPEAGTRPQILPEPRSILPEPQQIIRLPKMKEDTDTLAALRIAIQKGATEVTLFCALGGRLDHLIANLQLGIFAATHDVKLKIWDEHTRVTFLGRPATNPTTPVNTAKFAPQPGFSFSVFAVTDTAREVTIANALYEVFETTLTSSFPIGVSNEWLPSTVANPNPEITVSVREGVLAVVCSKLD
ncbi:MAG: thiamine pyrophosphokinase, partial [Arcanobacterium sp.]|nr:thiamine pyrophosphokinase [Arcanobacterium sp.]